MKKNFITKAATITVALLMATSLVACGGSTDSESENNGSQPSTDGEVPKPKQISMMATTIMTFENGLQQVCDEYEANTGIKLVIEKPDHNQYYEKVNLAFAGGTPADVIEMGSTYYPNFSTNGALWDMTDTWEESTSNVKSIVDEKYVDALKIDGRLYGFPMSKGNGTVTYVRQDWMDELGLKNPTNYDEFLDMLRAFKGKGGNIIPITAAGLINTETPYDIYLREFYQDAKPDIYKDPNTGQYIDGMLEPAMKEALTRMRDAYTEGLIDKEIVTNKTSTCRDKLNSGLVACFNYWAGAWNKTLEENTIPGDPNAKIRALTPIAETTYIERVPTAMVITNYAENPVGVFKYLIEYSHDGGEGQMLFTHGVEGTHWEKKEDGSVVALGYIETPEKLVEKSVYSPELTFTKFDDPIIQDQRIIDSLKIFEENSELSIVPNTSEVISAQLPELDTIKREVISKIVLGEMTIDEGIADYETRAASQREAIINDLNSK